VDICSKQLKIDEMPKLFGKIHFVISECDVLFVYIKERRGVNYCTNKERVPFRKQQE